MESSIRWMCIRVYNDKRRLDWFCEWTLSYSRKESIRLLTAEGTSTWRQLKTKHGWRCSKVKVTFTELTPTPNGTNN